MSVCVGLASPMAMAAGGAPRDGQIDAASSGGEPTNPEAQARMVESGRDRIALWSERSADGRTRSMYKFSIDGAQMSRALEATNLVRLRSADFDPLQTVPVATPLPVAGPVDDQPRLCIVQFIIPPLESMLQHVGSLGATPLIFLPDQSQIVRMNAAAREKVAALPFVRWVGDFLPAHKLDASLIASLATDPQALPIQQYSIEVFERGLVAGSTNGQQAVADRISALGGNVTATTRKGFRMQAYLSGPQLLEVAAMNQVQFVEVMGPGGVDMDVARQIGGAAPLLSGLGFTGQGVRGEVMDNGLRFSHLAFQTPEPLIHGQFPTIIWHGTCTFGIVFGNGAGNAAGTGMLPNREQGIFATYEQLNSQEGDVDRYDHTAELVNPAGPYRAVFQSNSWGNSYVTTYNTFSAEMDDILFVYDLLDCQSQSNNASQLSRPEAWAKNLVSVGGVSHFNTLGKGDDTWTMASIGPAADGRIKPDLTHFYDDVLCPTAGSDVAYDPAFGGTSAATPIVAGYFGLVFQMWHEGVFAGFGGGATVFDDRPHMATAKALMINSASRYNWLSGGNNGNLSRAKQGWGMPDLAKLYSDRAKTFIVDESDLLAPGGTRVYRIVVPAGQSEFRATLVYTDPKGDTASSIHRINDLNLQVVSPSSTTYWGNFGLGVDNYSHAGGSANNIDTVENVLLQNPAAGVWTVKVFGDVIVQDSHVETANLDADFALVVAGGTVLACPGDVTGNGVIDINDLVAVVINWGATGNNVPADANHDHIVGIDDLVQVVTHWGACP